MNKQMGVLEKKRERWGYIFILPWLLIFVIFYAYPLLYGFYVSFTDFSLNKMNWVGLANFKKIFEDYAFWRSLRGTLLYALFCIPLQVFLPLWAANTIRPFGRRASTLTKVLIYLPGVACSVSLIIAWKFMLLPNTGMVSVLIAKITGLTNFSIFDSAWRSIPVISLLIVLSGLGSNTIIYSAALDSIPDSYYEAAELDGATAAQQFWQITIPLLHSTIVYVLITATIGLLQIFVVPQLLTGGGPNYTSSTLLMLIYDAAFENNHFGYASAIGVILFIITGIIAIIQFRVTQQDTIEY